MKRIALCCALLWSVAETFGYGVDVSVALRHEHESLLVPINSMMFRMRLPDGGERLLIRNAVDSTLLGGDYPWMGKIRVAEGDGGKAVGVVNVLTPPWFKTDKTQFCFVDGRLKFMSVDEKDYEFNPLQYAVPDCTIASLWPDSADFHGQERVTWDIWGGTNRLRWFSSNPNRTALIFAEFGMVALGVALFAGTWWWRLPGIVFGFLSFFLLLRTESRCGFLAFLVALAGLLVIRFRKGIGWRFAVGLFAILIAAGVIVPHLEVAKGLSARLATATSEVFNGKRMYMWREVPRMIAAAPLGWGLLKSGPAYNSWFEKKDRMQMTGDLFNDHLSRLVEGGYVLGGLYVFAWAFVLLFSFRLAWKGGSPVALAVWLVYFISCIFNPMNSWGWSFLIPVLVSAWAVASWWRLRQGTCAARVSLFRHTLFVSLVVTGIALGGVAVIALRAPEQDVPLRVSWLGRQVVAGKGDPQVWVVEDGYVLDGNYFGFPGREIRDFYQAYPDAEALGLVSEIGHLPSKMRTLVLVGKTCESYLALPSEKRPDAERIIFLSPPLKYDKILTKVDSGKDVHVILGEFAARLEGGCEGAPGNVHVIPGMELYISGWLDAVIAMKGQVNE